jgi:hypothetical protein
MIARVVGSLVGAILSLLILSYPIGDNPLYRFALHVLVGVLVGFSAGAVVREVLLGMALPQLGSTPTAVVVPLVLGILLLFKGFPSQAFVGNISLAYLVGVGTAVALGGALLGTLVPQVGATGQALSQATVSSFRFGLVDGLMVVVGTVCTLLVFTFAEPSAERGSLGWRRVVDGAGWLGRLFLIFAYGVAFAGALTASLSIFVARMQHFIDLAARALGL